MIFIWILLSSQMIAPKRFLHFCHNRGIITTEKKPAASTKE